MLRSVAEILFVDASGFRTVRQKRFSVSFLIASQTACTSRPACRRFFAPVREFRHPMQSCVTSRIGALLRVRIVRIPFSSHLRNSSVSFPFLPGLQSMTNTAASVSAICAKHFSPACPFPESSMQITGMSSRRCRIFVHAIPGREAQAPSVADGLKMTTGLSAEGRRKLKRLPSGTPICIHRTLLPGGRNSVNSFPS